MELHTTAYLKEMLNKCDMQYQLASFKLEKYISRAKDVVINNLLKDETSAIDDMESIYEKLQNINQYMEKLANSTCNISSRSRLESNIINSSICEQQISNPNNGFPGEYFTFCTAELDKYTPSYNGECIIVSIKNKDQDLFFIINKDNIKNIDCQEEKSYDTLPESGVIFGVKLDNFLRRAVRQNDEKITDGSIWIYTIDTGDVLKILLNEEKLYHIPLQAQNMPAKAILCKLNKSSLNYNQSKRCLENWELLETIYFEVITKEKYVIEVILRNIPEDKSLKTVENLTEEEYKSFFEETKSTENAMVAIMGYSPTDEKRICKFYNPLTDGCFKGSYCKFLHVNKIQDGWTRDKEKIKTSIILQRPHYNVGDIIKIKPTHIVTVDKLFVHIASDPNLYSLSLLELNMNLNSLASQFKKFKTIPPSEQQLVFAQFIDEKWYRAKVIDICLENVFKVFYLDYGNSFLVNLDNLRIWDDRFDVLPFQAVPCCIANVKKIQDKHTEAILQLNKLLLNKTVNARITINEYVDDDDILTLNIFDPNGDDIVNYLINNNLAALNTKEGIISRNNPTNPFELPRLNSSYKSTDLIYKPG